MMNQPALYSKCNDSLIQESRKILSKYIEKLKFKSKHEKILDVGSGDGATLKNVLLPILPENFEELIGSDISKSMVEYLEKNIQHPKIKFIEMDIATDNLPISFVNRFDNIFSFFCLHRTQNPWQAMKNIYSMLKPGGQIFLALSDRSPLNDVFTNMSRKPKWTSYGHEKFLSPFHDSPCPRDEWNQVVKSAAFDNILCELDENRCLDYPTENDMRNITTSINPIFAKIPKDELYEYSQDYWEATKRGKMYHFGNCKESGKAIFQIHYNLITIVASKPE